MHVQQRQRPVFRFSLRTFVIVITVACIWTGWTVNRVRRQRATVEWVRSEGGSVYYDFEWNDDACQFVSDAVPPGPGLLRMMFGVDSVARPSAVIMSGHVTGLGFTYYSDSDVSDVSPLSSLRSLRYLRLAGPQVTDLAPITSLTELTELDLSDTSIRDVSLLSRLAVLRILRLGPAVTVESVAKLQRTLPNCTIYAHPYRYTDN